MPVENHRRYCLLKSQVADRAGDTGLAGSWRAKQVAIAGTELAADFPARDALAVVGYTTSEDVVGAEVDELMVAGLATDEAQAVVAALNPS